jgi:hypothetical protein
MCCMIYLSHTIDQTADCQETGSRMGTEGFWTRSHPHLVAGFKGIAEAVKLNSEGVATISKAL